MKRKIVDRSAALGADDVCAPAVLREAVVNAAGQGKGRVAPKIFRVVFRDAFPVIETLHWRVFRVIRQTQEETRAREPDIAGVFRLPE